MTFKNRIRTILLSTLLLGAAGHGWAGQTVKDVKRIYEKLVRANRLHAVPILVVDGPVNAYYDGSRIVVYTGLLNWVKNSDELAIVIGHELGHMKWKTEQRADEYGALYTRAAGFNYCRGAQVYKRMGSGDMPIHPPGADRYKAMRCK